MSRKPLRAVVGAVEWLEKRALLSAVLQPQGLGFHSLTLTGTDAADQIRVVVLGQGRVQVYGVEGVEEGAIYENVRSFDVYGGDGDDSVRVEGASGVGFWLYGGDGDDLLISEADTGGGMSGDEGDDTMVGSQHPETFSTEPGNDVYEAGGGDTMWHYGERRGPHAGLRLVARLDLGTIPEDGYGGQDSISGIQHMLSVAATDDIIFGDEKDNKILADYGRDSVFAGAGDDLIIANQGYATILAGSGNDTIHSSVWNVSYIDGGAGADVLHIGGFTEIPVGDTIVADKHDDVRYNLRPLDPEEPREAKLLDELKKSQRWEKRAAGLRLAALSSSDENESAFEKLLGKSKRKKAIIGKPGWMKR